MRGVDEEARNDAVSLFVLVSKCDKEFTNCHWKFKSFRVAHHLDGAHIGHGHLAESILRSFQVVKVVYVRVQSELICLSRLIQDKKRREETEMDKFIANCLVATSGKLESQPA